MSERLLLIDSDLFILVAAGGLFDTVGDLLGIPVDRMRRLEALPYMLQKPSRKLRRRYSSSVIASAMRCCRRIPGLHESPSPELLSRLLRPEDDIDDGEAFLFAHMVEQPHMLLGSGDKRAMIGLAKSNELQDIRASIAGRIISLEVVVELMLKTQGIDLVHSALTPLVEMNLTLKSLFGSPGPHTSEDRLRALGSYRKHLEEQVGDDFLYSV